jgi:hypothetical protein
VTATLRKGGTACSVRPTQLADLPLQLRQSRRLEGFGYVIDGLNSERIVFAAEAIGDGYGYWRRLGEQRAAGEARVAPEHLPERLAGTARLPGVRLTRR